MKIGVLGGSCKYGKVRLLCVCFCRLVLGRLSLFALFFYFLFLFLFSTFSHGSIFLSYCFSFGLRFVLLSSRLLFQFEFLALLELLAW
jgi:hypothetical protein